ncbi:HPF/RaiA family ribosome-associated protein [Lentzea sp. PSKA42]|uniref:HPF/RaiA family ribosome-associated protein n=1 Tax=Lentzea indica TaxID=2604800 RepID=A0ABX1FN69_9PSEU|nr:HPF/RaiA family ribosome-associated protein [Lentzea indica]NKE60360.1 HPF/RaiA family ribosome-associated protein [Lentzea indica]
MSELPEDTAVITKRLHLATGFLANERDWVAERLAALGSRLRSFRDEQVDLEISVKDRRGVEQRVTLECWINRTPRLHLVATSSEKDLPAALNEVRNELIRQVDVAKTRTEPRHNRALRSVPALPELDQPQHSPD